MQFDADIRLAAAAGGVARYFADGAGLDHAAVLQLQSATVAICQQQFAKLSEPYTRLEVVLERSPQSIEVAVKHDVSEDSRHSSEAQKAPAGVDQVQHEVNGGREITRLIKFLQHAGSAS